MPSLGASLATGGARARVVPSKDFGSREVECESYQLDCLVASLVESNRAVRSAVEVGAERSIKGLCARCELAVMTDDFFRRLICRPASSSEEEYSEEEDAWGGGVAGRLRIVGFLAVRFLKGG